MTTADLTFSLIVNTIDRAQSLRTLLRALEHQSYSHFEVIVVVGPTWDNTLKVLDEYAGRVRVLHCPAANLSQSRNIGLLAAHGDIVAYIDDDAVPSRNWLAQLARLFRDHALDGTGGVVYAIHPDFSICQFRKGMSSSLSEQVDVRASDVDQIIPSGKGVQWLPRVMGTNMAFRRTVLLQAGGFDEFYRYIAEESDLVFRLSQSGKTIWPVNQAVVYHVPASSRHRTVFTHQGNWWLRSRSRIYFTIKNGWQAGESIRSIIWRNFLSMGAHWLLYWNVWRARQLGRTEILRGSLAEIWSGIEGTFAGFCKTRQLIEPTVAYAAQHSHDSIVPFSNAGSSTQAAGDPVSGKRPAITLVEPPLRICLLSVTYPPAQYDGVARLTNLMARGLFERGHTVHVVTRGKREQISFYDCAYVHRIVPSLERYTHYRASVNLFHALNYSHTVHDRIKQLILNDGIQVVDSPLWQFEGLVTVQSKIVPVVVRLVTGLHQLNEIHASHAEEMMLMGDLEEQLVQSAAHIIPNTRATLATIKQFYTSAPEKPCTIVPYGIIPVPDEAIQPFDPACPPPVWTVLYVGRLEKRKGILDLFQAIPKVLTQVPNARFVIVGADNSRHDGFQLQTGTTYPEYFARHFTRYAAQIEFKGAISDEELQKLYAACHLFVAPSLYESFGLIYLEAMNYAKPVIGCRAGGIPEVVDDGVTGKLVEPGAPTELADAIVQLLTTPARLRELGIAGRERLLRDFTYLKMADAFARVYRQVIAEGEANANR